MVKNKRRNLVLVNIFTEMENGRHKIFNFQMSKLDTKIINEKLEEVFNKLDSAAKLCTKANLITIQGKFEIFDIVEQCTQERQNTKWRFKLITNITIFAAPLKTSQWDVQTLSWLNLFYDITR